MNKYFCFKPEKFLEILLKSVCYDICKKTDEELLSISFTENGVFYDTDKNRDVKLTLDDIYRKGNFNIYDNKFDAVFERAMIIIENNIEQLEQYNIVLDDDELYKYTFNLRTYLDAIYDSKVFFVNKNTFDDIFDCNVLRKHDEIMARTRILCLTDDKDIKAMWGLYSGSFKGACIEYHLHNIISGVLDKKNVPIFCYDDVKYEQLQNPSIRYVFLNGFAKKGRKQLEELSKIVDQCYYKDESWSFQKEKRMMILSSGKMNDFEAVDCHPSKVFKYNLKDKEIKEL